MESLLSVLDDWVIASGYSRLMICEAPTSAPEGPEGVRTSTIAMVPMTQPQYEKRAAALIGVKMSLEARLTLNTAQPSIPAFTLSPTYSGVVKLVALPIPPWPSLRL